MLLFFWIHIKLRYYLKPGPCYENDRPKLWKSGKCCINVEWMNDAEHCTDIDKYLKIYSSEVILDTKIPSKIRKSVHIELTGKIMSSNIRDIKFTVCMYNHLICTCICIFIFWSDLDILYHVGRCYNCIPTCTCISGNQWSEPTYTALPMASPKVSCTSPMRQLSVTEPISYRMERWNSSTFSGNAMCPLPVSLDREITAWAIVTVWWTPWRIWGISVGLRYTWVWGVPGVYERGCHWLGVGTQELSMWLVCTIFCRQCIWKVFKHLTDH